jgi:hypothetical protein
VERRVRFRATPLQIGLFVVPLVVTWSLVLLVDVRVTSAAAALPVLVPVALLSCGGGAALLRWRGLELTADAAVVRGDSVRRIPWSDVRDVRTRRRFGTRIVVLQTDRREIRCPAPFSGVLAADRHFDAKAAYVQRWWQACTPADQPGPRGDTGWGHPVLPGDLVS